MASVLTQLERVTQKLDAAEKKIDEYARLIASLSVELKRHQDIICHTCKKRIFRAGLVTASPSSSATVSDTSSIPSPTRTQEGQAVAEPSLLIDPILTTGDQINDYTDSLTGATSSSDNPQGIVALPIGTHYADADTELSHPFPSISETDEISTVQYNSEIEQCLSLHVANTFTFPVKVFCAKFSRDGNYVAVGLENGETHIYDVITGSKTVLEAPSATVFYTDVVKVLSVIWAVRFSPDNKYIATAGNDGDVAIWDISRRRVRVIFKHDALARSLDISPNGRFLVSASYDKSVCMRRVRDGSRTAVWRGSTDFMSVTFSPDGRFVAAGCDSGSLRIWDARTTQLVAKCMFGHMAVLRAMTFTPDGKGIASGGQSLQLLDVSSLSGIQSGRPLIKDDTVSELNQIFEFRGHTHAITAASFSADGRWVVSSSYTDHTIFVFDARSGAWVGTLKAHKSGVWAVDFSPAGGYLVSGGEDCRLRLWRYEVANKTQQHVEIGVY